MNVGKPLQTSDNIFMTEWVAIFRESGLRDDVTIANLQDACLKLVVLARARARLQVDQQVEHAQQPLSAKTAIPTTKPKPKGSTETDKPVQSQPLSEPMPSRKVKQLMHSHPTKEPRIGRKPRVNLKATTARPSLQPRVVKSTLTRMPRLIKKKPTNLKDKTMIKRKIQKQT